MLRAGIWEVARILALVVMRQLKLVERAALRMDTVVCFSAESLIQLD